MRSASWACLSRASAGTDVDCACCSPATVLSSRYSGLSASDLAAWTQWASAFRAYCGEAPASPHDGVMVTASARSPGCSPSLRHNVLTPMTLPAGSDNRSEEHTSELQ